MSTRVTLYLIRRWHSLGLSGCVSSSAESAIPIALLLVVPGPAASAGPLNVVMRLMQQHPLLVLLVPCTMNSGMKRAWF